MSEGEKPIINVSGTFLGAAMYVSTVAGAIFVNNWAIGYDMCESQAPRVTASTDTNIFNRCTRKLPDGTVLIWNKQRQHQKDLASGAALKLK